MVLFWQIADQVGLNKRKHVNIKEISTWKKHIYKKRNNSGFYVRTFNKAYVFLLMASSIDTPAWAAVSTVPLTVQDDS